MRNLLIALLIGLGSATATSANAAVSVNIGINLPTYPRLVPIPGYPVYYAPGVNSNYFFYDGLYWVFDGENWYDSRWYNGPWTVVDPFYVPSYVLRVPVRYYRHAPAYFRGWRSDAAPRWNERWGRDWESRRGDWNRGPRGTVQRAPLPDYQRRYSGDRYPRAEQQQQQVHNQNYRYQPRDEAVRQRIQEQARGGDQRQGRAEGREGRGEGRESRGEGRESRGEGRGGRER